MRNFLKKLGKFLGRLSKKDVFAIGFLLVIILGLADYWVGIEISLSFFYLIPIFMTTWHLGIGMGYVFTFISIAAWAIAHRLTGHTYAYEIIHYWDMFLRLVTFTVFAFLLNELKSSIHHERALSRTDDLTGINNRREFFNQAELEIKRACRYGQPLSMAYFDLDSFKQVNDAHGHTEGDKLLVAITRAISSAIRQTDLFARLGGDEFAILLPNTAQEDAKLALQKVETIMSDETRSLHSSAKLSMGVVTFNSPPKSVDEMLNRADTLMYQAKMTGKHQTLYAQVD